MVLDTIHKQKSFAITLVIMGLIILLLLMAKLGMHTELPEEGGEIAITFGTDSQGMGEITPPKTSETSEAQKEEIVEKDNVDSSAENLITQETEEETITIPPKKVKKEKPKEQKPSSSTTNALSNVMNAISKSSQTGSSNANQGDDGTPGYKGDPNGNPYANSFYGGSGTGGSGKGWGLNGRKNISGENIRQDCNEAGFVVVQIEVDRNGKVIRAKAGQKGTTNSAPCLLEAARKSALTYRFNADEKAPQTQIGFITINFRLGE
ncbi:hypothetical protein [uncultured Capnocytophaga sp.]|mgnify:FL=1|uniref:hypothetical protein n=1 Tax=uncultured Capnocytophaga sp. TaxID=159273 RepID=UPI00261254EE|nr:hypothetical protein [uncultured Capnocytophaga sp.]